MQNGRADAAIIEAGASSVSLVGRDPKCLADATASVASSSRPVSILRLMWRLS